MRAQSRVTGDALDSAQIRRAERQRVAQEALLSDWASLSRYRTANDSVPAPERGENRVVYIGDSITESWASYFPTLFPGQPYFGRGISGQTTPQILVRFRQDVVALEPRVVVILAGTNDIAGNTGPSSLAMIQGNLASMAEIARANGIRVVLSSVLPVYDYPWKRGLDPAPKISALNAWIRSYSEATGAVYLDYHAAMVDSRGGLRAELTTDGVHPNAAGYRVMAPLAEEAIANALRPSVIAPARMQARQWFRGNTHAHTANSDGDSPPDSVVRWYRDADYDFLFITDHERITDPAPLNARFGTPGQFLVLAGEEVTQLVADAGHPDRRRQAHVNGLGLQRVVVRLGERGIADSISMQDAYAGNITEIRRAGGIAQVNHPNFRWSVRLGDLTALPESTLFEIWNAHPGVNNLGGVDSDGRAAPSAEALWDSLLTRGKVVFGVADDDSHSFRPGDADSYELTRPGRAWIMVRADTLSESAVLTAIRSGDFYASTGVTLRELAMTGPTITVAVAPVADSRYTIEFIGTGGRVLATVHGRRAAYTIRGGERYVRVRITDSNGRMAWTQATPER